MAESKLVPEDPYIAEKRLRLLLHDSSFAWHRWFADVRGSCTPALSCAFTAASQPTFCDHWGLLGSRAVLLEPTTDLGRSL